MKKANMTYGWLSLRGSLLLMGMLLASTVFGVDVRASDRPRVVVTTTMLRDMVERVGGDEVAVHGLMGPGVDPHMYRASASDIGRLRRADLILYNGLALEGRLGDVLAGLSAGGRRVVGVAERLPESELLPSEEEGEIWDPHVWGSPELWRQCTDIVVGVLSELLPDRAEEFRLRGEGYKAEIAALAEWGMGRLSAVPVDRRVLITSHDAFGYFGRSFEFEVIGVQGISTASEAGLANIAAISDLVRSRGIPAVFVESSVSPAAIQRLARDSGARIGGELYSDATGTPGQIESGPDGIEYDVGTWNGMMRHNINLIAAALAAGDSR